MVIECTPSNYDAGAGGNIFYGPGVLDGDFAIRLVDRPAVAYDRSNPDDELHLGNFDPAGFYRYGAVVAVPGDSTHTGDIAVSSSADVTSAGAYAHGYLIGHIGASGRIRLDLDGGSVTTNGVGAAGIQGFHASEGDINAATRGTVIRVEGDGGAGVWLRHTGTGDIGFRAVGGSVDAVGAGAYGIFSDIAGSTGSSAVDLRDVTVSASGAEAYGIFNHHQGEGDSVLTLWDTAVTASGNSANAVIYQKTRTGDLLIEATGPLVNGIVSTQSGTGNSTVNLRDVTVSASGEGAYGILNDHRGEGDINFVAKGGSTVAEGVGTRALNFAHLGTGDIDVDLKNVNIAAVADAGIPFGIAAHHLGAGDLAIGAEGGRIVVVNSDTSYGVFGQLLYEAEDNMAVDLRNVVVTAEGEEARGVYLINFGTDSVGDLSIHLRDTTVTAAGDAVGIGAFLGSGKGSIRIRLDGGSVDTREPGGNAVVVGNLDEETGDVVFAADVGADGYRRQSVMVNGRVRGGSGDGSGIQIAGGGRIEIGPRGSVGAESGVAVRTLGDGAALYVGSDFDGRLAGEVVDGSIRNDDGRTTIAVNGVTLHDGMAGATGLWAPNGARDVTLVAADAVSGRAFSAADFVTGPYAPRAAVYEALPGFLLRLDEAGEAAGERLRRPDSPGWVRVSRGQGS